MEINCYYKESCTEFQPLKCEKCANNRRSYFKPLIKSNNDSSEKDIPIRVLANFTFLNEDKHYQAACPSCNMDSSNQFKHYPDPYDRCPNCNQKIEWI